MTIPDFDYDWKKLYAEAIVEADRVEFILKKSLALRAILHRLLADTVAPDEREELKKALANLRDLRAGDGRNSHAA
jgi:hypothetical protein